MSRIPPEADAEIFAAYDSLTRARNHLKRIAKRCGVGIQAIYQRAWRAGYTSIKKPRARQRTLGAERT